METTNIQQAINLIDQIDSLMLDLCEELEVEQLAYVIECKESFDILRGELEDRFIMEAIHDEIKELQALYFGFIQEGQTIDYSFGKVIEHVYDKDMIIMRRKFAQLRKDYPCMNESELISRVNNYIHNTIRSYPQD